MKTWGDVFNKHVRRGVDHGYAAFMADRYMERKMAHTIEFNTNKIIARWLGYRRHSVFTNNWHLPDAPDNAPDSELVPTPDFANGPVHYERIKAWLRELELRYELGYRPSFDEQKRHDLCCYGIGEWCGASEGEVLVKCALALIAQGEKS